MIKACVVAKVGLEIWDQGHSVAYADMTSTKRNGSSIEPAQWALTASIIDDNNMSGTYTKHSP